MGATNNSPVGQLTSKRRKLNLRRCASFERGKCTTCDKLDTGDNDCDMKKTGQNGRAQERLSMQIRLEILLRRYQQ